MSAYYQRCSFYDTVQKRNAATKTDRPSGETRGAFKGQDIPVFNGHALAARARRRNLADRPPRQETRGLKKNQECMFQGLFKCMTRFSFFVGAVLNQGPGGVKGAQERLPAGAGAVFEQVLNNF
jgi:hypothetical protein